MGYFLKNREIGKRPNGVVVPNGYDADRPPAPTSGLMRYNNDIGTMEFWDNIAWIPVVIPGTVQLITDKFTGDGIVTIFTASQVIEDENQIMVFVGGVLQDATTSFSTSVTNITFLIPPPEFTVVLVIHNLGKIA